jgi:imidazolonepropionase-like amidohydrolase
VIVFFAHRGLRLLAAVTALAFCQWALAAPPSSTAPPNGLRVNTPQVHALTNARLQVTPEKVIERGTVVVRNGRIVAAGRDVEAPADAQVWDLAGKTIYAGFIDAYNEQPIELATKLGGAPYWNEHVRPQLDVAKHLTCNTERNALLRSQGITSQFVAPAGAIMDGGCVLVSTADDPASETLLAERGPRHLRLTVQRNQSRDNYPASPMGAVALARQAMLDAQWYQQAWGEHEANPLVPRPERNDALAALAPPAAGEQIVLIDAPNEWYFLRAQRFAEEFKLKAIIVGSGREYRRLDDVAASGLPVIVPLNFPQPPNVASPQAALDASLTTLLHWDVAPENPARLAQAGVTIAFTAHGLKDVKDFLPRLREAVERGLSREKALAALTTNAAKLCQAEKLLGTIEVGRIANLVVTDGDLFDKETKIERTWIDGKPYAPAPNAPVNLRGTWDLSFQRDGKDVMGVSLELSGDDKLTGKLLHQPKPDEAASDVPLSHVGQRETRLSAAFDSEKLGAPGVARLTAVATISSDDVSSLAGHVTWPDNRVSPLTGKFAGKLKPADTKKPDDKNPLKKEIDRAASFAVNYPLGPFGVEQRPPQPKAVLFTHATIWTCDEGGILKDASLLVESGKIIAIGPDLEAPAGALVIDCAGRHLTPGIIDCHSHAATDGGINEMAQAITAEVRIGDFIDPDDVNVYRQLAGGVTTINVLHGSANPIGGQNQVCKLRWGETDAGMKFREAPAGIKFALGENVKQANWGDKFTSRYPQTRMGVEQLMRDEFIAARKYIDDHAGRRANELPPRRDLELEAVAEILQGKRWIHCHSYRQDEILAFLKLTDEFQVQIATLQHILEGYKVADAMAQRKIGGSAFSDWWAYKLEVYDAIPHNGLMMHKAGVIVSFNSDDLELARHLNQEAAKAVKYGGLSPEEALRFVTLNPAKQLRIDEMVGSLVVGKQADVAVWSGPPLAITSRCEQTWIDGRKYFDRVDDLARRTESSRRHALLVQKVLQSGDAMLGPNDFTNSDPDLWPRHDEFCTHAANAARRNNHE